MVVEEVHAREVDRSDKCPLGAEMDTSQQVTVNPKDREGSVVGPRQRRSIAEKRRIVEETLAPGASVARVARVHGVNANQVFGWRRLYLAGRLGEQKPGIKLLPVRVSESKSAPVVVEHDVPESLPPQPGTIHIELRQAQVRIEGNADPALLRVLLECLRA
jgi:transposase